MRHDAETVQWDPVIRGITFVSSLELTSLSFMLVQNPVLEMPAIPLSLPFMTFSHVPRSFMSSSAQPPLNLLLLHQLGQRQAIVNKRGVAIFCQNLLRAKTLLPLRGFPPLIHMAEVGTWSWDHFLADERRFTSAKDGIGAPKWLASGLRPAYLRSWNV